MKRLISIMALLAICFSALVPEAALAQSGRRPTGVNGSLQFNVGERVTGVTLTYIDGWYASGPCYLARAEAPGTVSNGVVNPWPEEIRGFPACEFQPPVEASQPAAAAPQAQRRTTGIRQSGPFNLGETVAGTRLEYPDGWFAEGPCVLTDAPVFGTVTNGVVWPWAEEIAGFPTCSFQPPAQASQPAAPAAATTPQRRPTGIRQSGPFAAGESVAGTRLEYPDGSFAEGPCVLTSAPAAGTVTNGVVWPWQEEIAGFPACSFQAPAAATLPGRPRTVGLLPPYTPPAPSQETVNGLPRRETGQRQTLSFNPGEAVIGAEIGIDGVLYRGCFIPAAGLGGYVTTGVVNPWPDEVLNRPLCQVPFPIPIVYPQLPPASFPMPDRRQPTGVGGSLRFSAGTPVVGADIRLDDGRQFSQCYIGNPPTSGSVTSGVLFPDAGELLTACSTQASGQRQPTGEGGTLRFNAGAAVVGALIQLDDGRSFNFPCFIPNAPTGGSVTSGVIWPNADEHRRFQRCF